MDNLFPCSDVNFIYHFIHADIIHNKVIGKFCLCNIAVPLSNLLSEFYKLWHLRNTTCIGAPSFLTIDIENIFIRLPMQTECMKSFAQASPLFDDLFFLPPRHKGTKKIEIKNLVS